MIKKILSSFLVSSALFVFAATSSFADRPTIAIGYTAAYGAYNASGQENEGAPTNQEKISRDVTGAYGFSSFFIEATFADRVTVGASWMMDEIETELTSRTDTIAPGSQQMAVNGSFTGSAPSADGGINRGSAADTGTSKVSAEFSNLVTGYVELNIWKGLYAKYGIMTMDVDTKESLHTDSQYPNAEMDGTTYGLGWKGSFDNGVFIKTETMMQDWTDLKINATGVRTGGTDNNNSVQATLAGALATISIGRAF